jgi:hypothetical protein
MYYFCSEYIELATSELVHIVSPTMTYLRKCACGMSKLKFGSCWSKVSPLPGESDHDNTLHSLLGILRETFGPSSKIAEHAIHGYFILDFKHLLFLCYVNRSSNANA